MHRFSVSALAAVTLLASGLFAQVEGEPPFEACKPGGFSVIAYPDEFGPQRTGGFQVVIDNKFQGQFLTTQRIWLPVIAGALEKWNSVPGATWRFDVQGLTSQQPMGIDGRVTIASCGFEFGCKEMVPVPPEAPPDPMLPPTVVPQFTARQAVLAVTLVSADFSREKAILDADVFFNPEIPYQTEPNQGQIDFESVLLHELGHVVGLGHNDNCSAGSTVMESFIDVGQRKRELQGPETEGLKFLYPDDSSPAIRIYEHQRNLRFDAQAGKLPPFGQQLRLFGARGADWTASVTTSSGGNWVVLDPPQGRFISDGMVEISVDSTALAPGDYTARVAFSKPGHSGPPATADISLRVTAGSDPRRAPSFSTSGIVSAANLSAPLTAPGGLITIFGENLATTTAQAGGFPLPTNLGGTEVVVNGRLASLLYVSPGQVNAQFPVGAEFGRGGIIVRTGLGQSQTIFMESAETAPQVFTANGRVLALNQDGSLNAVDNPARGGTILTLFLTGQGPVDPPVASGQPGGSSPLSEVILPATAEIGGRQVEILYLGLAPGLAGVGQTNLRVPAGLNGNLPVRLTIGGRISNTAVISAVGE